MFKLKDLTMIKSVQNYIKVVIFILPISFLNGQQLYSTFLRGDISGGVNTVRSIGPNPLAYPEPLAKSCMWGGNGAIFLFGGEVFENNDSKDGDYLINNRLWTYTNAGGWSIISGSTGNVKFGKNGTTLNTVSYGQQGIASASNQIGARAGAAHARAANGDLYVFGGYGQGANGFGLLGDLWKWDGANWTWVSGSSNINPNPSYGTQGSAAGSNNPGARKGAVMWFDEAGDLFLFGGSSSGYGFTNKTHNSLWKWDGANWTWIDGSSATDVGATVTNNVATYPQSFDYPAFCKTQNGDVYFYGGGRMYGTNDTVYQPQNTFWRFDGQQWDLISGSHSNPNNFFHTGPLPRVGAILNELNGVFHLHGGYWTANGIFDHYLDDAYKFDGQAWSQNSRLSGTFQSEHYGVYATSTKPGEGSFAASCKLGDEVFIYGGERELYIKNRFLKFNGQSYADLGYGYSSSSDQYFPGLATIPQPGSRFQALHWYDKSNKTLYVFGGQSAVGVQSDLWKYENGYWAVTYGGIENQSSDYSAPGLHPGSRREGVIWKDKGDTLWLFGGYGPDSTGNWGLKNDLWYLIGNAWHHYRGSAANGATGVYGSVGVAASTNTPGARRAMKVWVDANGDAYMFGGVSNVSDNSLVDSDVLNDLWKFNGLDWIWLGGSQTGGSAGNNGTISVAATGNIPSARYNYALTGDDNGFYLFGGTSVKLTGGRTYANDLWYYDFGSNLWTWLAGGNNAADKPTESYGPATANSSTNGPGYLFGSYLLLINDQLFLSGGLGAPGDFFQNSVWHWDGSAWAWLKGIQNPQSHSDTKANYGDSMEGSFAYYPSGRIFPVAWSDGDVAYLYGGLGVNYVAGTLAFLDDIWAHSLGNFWDGSTWSQGTPISANSDAQVLGNNPQAANLTTRDLVLDADFSLDINTKDLSMHGDFYNYGGAITNQGNLYITGDQTQNIYGNIFDLHGVMEISPNSTLETNDLLRIKQTSNTDYGQLVPWGTIIDSLYFERYFELPSGNDNARTYLISLPSSGKMSRAKIDGYSFSDPNNPGSSNWRTWNPSSSSWEVPDFTNSNYSHTQLDAYWVYAGNSTYGNFITANGQSGTIEVKGFHDNLTPGYLYSTDDGQSSNVGFVGGTSEASTRGWILFGNPYLHNFDLASILSVNSLFDNGIYIWDGSNYATFINGLSVNGGTGILAPGQAAFIQCNGAYDNLHGLTVTRSMAYPPSSATSLFKTSNAYDGVKVRVIEELDTTKQDEIWLGFASHATMNFDSGLEAWDLWNADGVPNLAVPIVAGNLSIATFNQDSTRSQRIYLSSDAQGQYMKIEVNTASLKSFGEVYLEDSKFDYLQSLTANNEYRFMYDSTDSDERFILHFSQGLELPKLSHGMEWCYPFKQGSEVFLRCLNSEFDSALEVKVYDLSGILHESLLWNPEAEGDLKILENRKSGLYIVELRRAGDLNPKSQRLKVLK